VTRIKICGITTTEDALFCANAGVDFLGMIFVPKTPRYITPARAKEIVGVVQASRPASPPKFVGVFRDASPAEMRRIAETVGLDLVQLHGNETDDDARAVAIPAIKSVHVGDTLPDTGAVPSAEWLLFDTLDDRRSGGTGRRFNWSLLSEWKRTKPFFLAGGLDPDNIGAAISLVRPDAVDVSSGVERAPGVKDHEKVRHLIERVRRV
jgi:phosphoribosylanthranilate isomerase